MLCRFAYLLVHRFLDVLSGRFRSRLAKEVEIAVLRHQVEVFAPSGEPSGSCAGGSGGVGVVVAAARVPGGPRLWSRRRRSCVGIAIWCVAAGPTPSTRLRCGPCGLLVASAVPETQ